MDRRADNVDVSQGVMLTDDFAPADLNALRNSKAKKKQ